MKKHNTATGTKCSRQYQEDLNTPVAIETMYYLFLCQGYSGEMED